MFSEWKAEISVARNRVNQIARSLYNAVSVQKNQSLCEKGGKQDQRERGARRGLYDSTGRIVWLERIAYRLQE